MHPNITGLILAGGRGTRMNHRNKGLVEFRGKPLIEHVIERLAPQVKDIVISANSDLDTYKKFGHRVIEDIAGSNGPLSGIQSSASVIESDMIFITACDMPFLPVNIVGQLMDDFVSHAVMAETTLGREPLACLVKKSAINKIADLPTGQTFSVYKWLEVCSATSKLVTTDRDAFLNINSAVELDSAEVKNSI